MEESSPFGQAVVELYSGFCNTESMLGRAVIENKWSVTCQSSFCRLIDVLYLSSINSCWALRHIKVLENKVLLAY